MNQSLWLDSPKFLIKDLKCCRKFDNKYWEYIVSITNNNELNKTIQFKSVYIEGFIDQKPCDDVMILQDTTGKVKLSNCSIALQNEQIQKGDYCSVLGELIREKGLPEITPQKLICLDNKGYNRQFYDEFWPIEVKDFHYFIIGVINPNLNL